MYKTKLIKVFQSLNKEERKLLKQFVAAPIYNKHKEVSLLFQYLVKLKKIDENTVDREKVFSIVYPNEEFDYQRLRHIMTYLLRVIEQFLMHQEFFNDPIQTSLSLVKAYRKKGLEKLYTQNQVLLEQSHSHQLYRNVDYYEQLFQIKNEEYLQFQHLQRSEPINLNEISQTLDLRFITRKLHQAGILLTYQSVYKTAYDFGLIDEVIRYVEDRHLLDIPVIAIYYYSYKMLTIDGKELYFLEFKRLINRHSQLFTVVELRDLYVLAINYCIKRINLGQENIYGRQLFDLYQQGLDKQVIFKDENLPRSTYINIAVVGLGVKEYDWVEQFIHQYKDDIAEEYRETSYHFNLANLAYKRQDYDQAMELLRQLSHDDIFLHLHTRLLLLKIYYERKEESLFNSYLQSFENFVRRKKNIGYHKTSYLHFIRFAKKLNMINPFDRDAQNKLRQEINDTPIFPERKWLLERLVNL